MGSLTPVCSPGQRSQVGKAVTLQLFPLSINTDIYTKHFMKQVKLSSILCPLLTSVKAEMVNAPLIDECFMNLECRFRWEKEIVDGDDHVLICLEIVNVHIDEKHMDESNLGRTGETGILYNIHHPINPENFKGTAHDYVGTIKKIRDYSEY